MLALAAPRPLHREQLIEAMWPASDLESGARQLHVAVSSLRRVLNSAGLAGAELLSRRGDAYALAVSRGSLDVADLEAALREMDAARAAGDLAGCAAAARTALQVYTGDLLPEDGPADWVVPHRDRLRRGAASAAAVVAAELRRQSDHEAAVAATHRWIDLDPYADPAWELLSGLHEDVGDRAAAARCRQDHGRLLADLGVL
jgi:DNA-binding SARP family transcriptional activator